ncbi:MAG: hypothetical protein RMN51_01370 [Verrucomicrobiota bacterium]|nr:hypothetical protein [Verrucomicrobiota bacterium]
MQGGWKFGLAIVLAVLAGILLWTVTKPRTPASVPPGQWRDGNWSARVSLDTEQPANVASFSRVERLALQFLGACRGKVWRRSAVWDQVIEPLRSDELAELVQKLDPVLRQPVQEELRLYLMERWARRDPSAAVMYLSSWPASQLRDAVLSRCARLWLESNLEDASQWIRSLPDSMLRHELVNVAVLLWAQVDPQEALRWVQELPAMLRGSSYQEVFHTWAMDNPGAAWEMWQRWNTSWSHKEAALTGLFRGWARLAPEQAVEQARAMSPGPWRRRAMQSALEGWVTAAPSNAVAHLASWPADAERTQAVMTLLENWPDTDFTGARLLLDLLPQGLGRKSALEILLPSWVRADPGAALAAVQALPDGPAKIELLGMVFQQWGLDAPEAALAELKKLPPGTRRSDWLEGLFQQLADRDVRHAIQSAEEWPPGEEKNAIAAALARSLVRQDPALAAHLLDRLPIGPAHRELVPEIAVAYLQAHPEHAQQWIHSLPEGLPKQLALQRIAQWMTQQHPESAMQWALSLEEPGVQSRILETVIQQWTRQDPIALWTWFSSLRDPSLKSHVARAWTIELAYADPALALDVITQHVDSSQRHEALDRLAHTWARWDLQSAVPGLSKLKSVEEKDAYLNGLIRAVAETDPGNALRIWLQHGTFQTDASAASSLRLIFAQWAMNDPKSAVNELSRIPDGQLRAEMLYEAGYQWSIQAPAQYEAWLRTLPPDAYRDVAVAAHVDRLASENPQMATSWLSWIQDDRIRQQKLHQIAAHWLRINPQQASAWLATQPNLGTGQPSR